MTAFIVYTAIFYSNVNNASSSRTKSQYMYYRLGTMISHDFWILSNFFNYRVDTVISCILLVELWFLARLSTIFQLYRGDQLYWWRIFWQILIKNFSHFWIVYFWLHHIRFLKRLFTPRKQCIGYLPSYHPPDRSCPSPASLVAEFPRQLIGLLAGR